MKKCMHGIRLAASRSRVGWVAYDEKVWAKMEYKPDSSWLM